MAAFSEIPSTCKEFLKLSTPPIVVFGFLTVGVGFPADLIAGFDTVAIIEVCVLTFEVVVHTRIVSAREVLLLLGFLIFPVELFAELSLSGKMGEMRNSGRCPMTAGMHLLPGSLGLVSMQNIFATDGIGGMQKGLSVVDLIFCIFL